MAVTEDLRETLLIAREALGPELHPIYIARLQLIWSMLQWAVKQEPAHWQAALERAERIVDQTQRSQQ